MADRTLGKLQRDLLVKIGSGSVMVVGDKLSASLVRRGLLAAEPDGSFARITAQGLRALAAELDAGRVAAFSVEGFRRSYDDAEHSYGGSGAMKVWVAVGAWNYDGHDMPVGVFTTEKLAREAISADRFAHYDDVRVVAYELDRAKADDD